MPTFNWLKNAFADGYSSGDIASPLPNWRRWHEERRIGGSYRRVLAKGIYVPQNAVVLEIGHGRGSWTRALLKSHANVYDPRRGFSRCGSVASARKVRWKTK